jgi:hypothetical protein
MEKQTKKPHSYSDFTPEHLNEMFGIKTEYANLNLVEAPFTLPPWLAEMIFEYSDGLPKGNEKIKSEIYISPVLLAFYKANKARFKYFSGYTFDVDVKNALKGRCDYLLSMSASVYIDAPIFGIFEAKDDNIERWYGQCGAEMYAAQLFNAQRGNAISTIHGAVSNGQTWQFLRLEQNRLWIDKRYYAIENLQSLLGTLQGILEFYA